jgi:predicted transcriptional regulator
MSDLKAKRYRNEILSEILELCREPTAKTRITYKTNISYAALLKLLKQLQKFELLTIEKSSKKYATTDKGKEYISRWTALQELLSIQNEKRSISH